MKAKKDVRTVDESVRVFAKKCQGLDFAKQALLGQPAINACLQAARMEAVGTGLDVLVINRHFDYGGYVLYSRLTAIVLETSA